MIFTVHLFVKVKCQKQPKYPSVGEWLNKLWYIYTMEHYSAIKIDGTIVTHTTWMTVKEIMPNKRSQSQKFSLLLEIYPSKKYRFFFFIIFQKMEPWYGEHIQLSKSHCFYILATLCLSSSMWQQKNNTDEKRV